RVFIQDDSSRMTSVEENHRVFERSFRRTIEALRTLGMRVVVVGPTPEIKFSVPEAIARELVYDKVPEDISLLDFMNRNKFVLSTFASFEPEVEFIYPHHQLCMNGKCLISKAGHPLYVDNNHLSKMAALHTRGLFEPLFLSMKEAATTSHGTLPLATGRIAPPTPLPYRPLN